MSLSDRFDRALLFVAERHREHRRKNSAVPYVAHLLSVAALVLYHGGGEDEAIAALLHDTVEDGKASLAEVSAHFGARVAAIVEGCSEPGGEPRPPWRERKAAYIQNLSRADASVCLVAAADKLDNIRAVLRDYDREGDRVWDRFRAGPQEQLWFYRTVRETLRGRVPGPLLAELDAALKSMERLAGR